MSETFLVRHGNANYDYDILTKKGQEDAKRAGRELLKTSLGTTGLILSSDAGRAFETATIIGDFLGVPVTPSKRINIAGNDPEVVADLDQFLADTLESEDVTLTDEQHLIVVTHAPLIAIAKGLRPSDTSQVQNGEVVRLGDHPWNASFYNPALYARLLGDK